MAGSSIESFPRGEDGLDTEVGVVESSALGSHRCKVSVIARSKVLVSLRDRGVNCPNLQLEIVHHIRHFLLAQQCSIVLSCAATSIGTLLQVLGSPYFARVCSLFLPCSSFLVSLIFLTSRSRSGSFPNESQMSGPCSRLLRACHPSSGEG